MAQSYIYKLVVIDNQHQIEKENTEFMDKKIDSFIDSVIEQKKLEFSVDETSFDNSLFEENILKSEQNKISISDYSSISSNFLDKYKEKLGFKISEVFDTNVSFINNIKEDFTNNSYVPNYHILEKEIWKAIIKESNTKYKCSFYEYLSSIDIKNKPNEIFSFIEAYSSILPILELTDIIIFENALIQMEITKSDAEFNSNLGGVLIGIKNKCKVDYDTGLNLLKKSISISEEKENLLSAVITGLYENKRIEFYNSVLEALIEKGNKLNSILFGLSNVTEIEDVECKLFIKLIKKYNKDDSLIISILSLVISILKSNKTKYHKFCFKELELGIENEKAAFYILNNLDQIDNYNQEKTQILIKLINQNYFSVEKYINLISNVFWRLKEFDSFKRVVLSIIENKPFKKFFKNFQSYFHSVDSIELDKFTIELLTDNQASKRSAGLDLFDNLSAQNPYKFSFDILELPHFTQYKLWVSLTQDFYEPQNRITALLPLIDSKSELIKESFLCKLEELSEDYGGHIAKVLEDNLNESEPNNNEKIQRIRCYIEDFYSRNVDIKTIITELNPYHTHYNQIKYFDKVFYKKMSESIDKGAKENSLFSILTNNGSNTIQLSKGGGFKIGNKKEISQLGRVGTSFTMPRSYFINPNEYELEKGFLVKKDWTDKEFLDIKTFLDNE